MSLSTDEMIRALFVVKATEQRQANRVALLIAIACCVGWIRWGHPALMGIKDTATTATTAVTNAIAPDLGESPKAGDKIGPYTVSSPYGPRLSPCQGCSSDHKGVDVAAPHGSQQYIPDSPAAVVTVECFTYSFRGQTEQGARFTTSYGLTIRSIHLSKCDPGTHRGGQVFGLTGTSGTGAHAHIEVYRNGEIMPPPASVLWWLVTGEQPRPTIYRGDINDAK